ncbi:MAG: hypothetical protein HY823_11815 [Acidobacteria bacterium]|nr:hypothetical protein [Acidobacteriota bacterium]
MRRDTALAGGMQWIDIQNPSPGELDALGAELGLHATSLGDCMQPDHLSKFERYGEVTFILVRSFDPEALTGTTLRTLTHKVAIFIHPRGLLTVHRGTQACVEAALRRQEGGQGPSDPLGLATEIVAGSLASFEAPLSRAEASLDRREGELFERRGGLPSLRSIHGTKRRIRTLKRSLWRTLAAIQGMKPLFEGDLPRWQDLKEHAERLHAIAEELLEEASGLIHLELSVNAQRTNEVMRVLTIFSAFFLPLTFIAGVYGMNFQHMPELKWPWGYAFSLGLMGAVVLSILAWFRRRGWMK